MNGEIGKYAIRRDQCTVMHSSHRRPNLQCETVKVFVIVSRVGVTFNLEIIIMVNVNGLRCREQKTVNVPQTIGTIMLCGSALAGPPRALLRLSNGSDFLIELQHCTASEWQCLWTRWVQRHSTSAIYRTIPREYNNKFVSLHKVSDCWVWNNVHFVVSFLFCCSLAGWLWCAPK